MKKSRKKATKKANRKKQHPVEAKADEKPPETAAPAPIPESGTQDAPADAKTTPPGGTKGDKKAAPASKQTREGSKKAAILDLIRRNDSASVKELMAATDWLPHSVSGFVSNLVRKDGQKIEPVKRALGERAYHPATGQ
jgi:hypothetical protein